MEALKTNETAGTWIGTEHTPGDTGRGREGTDQPREQKQDRRTMKHEEWTQGHSRMERERKLRNGKHTDEHSATDQRHTQSQYINKDHDKQ